MNDGLFDPRVGPHDLLSNMYKALHVEIGEAGYSAPEIAMLKDPIFYYGRYLEKESRDYALYTISRNISRASRFLKVPGSAPVRLLDVGCGLGMQSIFFSLLGADVVGLDVDQDCIALCWKRQGYYERQTGRSLSLRFECDRFPSESQALAGGFDAVFSMSAFVHMAPIEATVSATSKLLRPGGRVFLWDLNSAYLFRSGASAARSLPSPRRIARLFEACGVRIDCLTGGAAVPRQFWRRPSFYAILSLIDRRLARLLSLSFNFILGATRLPDEESLGGDGSNT